MANWRNLLLVIAVHLVHCNEDLHNDIIPLVYEPSWMYKCYPNDGCQRTENPQPTHGNDTQQLFASLDVCRTVCGRFGGLWPKPVTAALSTHTVLIHPNYLRFDLVDIPAEARELVVEMSRLVGPNLHAECDGNVTEMVETPIMVYISVKSAILTLDWNTDEQYVLDVQSKERQVQVRISAETVYGARHALETFTQLAAADRPDYSDQKQCSLRLVSGAKIRDHPAYKHRGFVLDSSRHFIPLKDIKRTINGMAATKMNVFHWHVTDSHSFPLESTRVPQFTRYGAYSPNEIYSTEEVKDLIKYAQVRGVRMVIEIDSPAHASNGWQWGKDYGFGDLAVCVNEKNWRKHCIQPPCGQLNPANPAMYRVLKDLYRDVANLLPQPALLHVGGDEFPCGQLNPANPAMYRVLKDLYREVANLLPQPALLHVGGDEVFFACWNSSEEITSYMETKGYDSSTTEGFIKLWAEFHEKALQLWDGEVIELGGSQQPVMIWSSELTQANRIQKYLSKERYVIEVWEPVISPLLTQLLRLGYQTVSIPKDIWYLDRGFWGNTAYSNWRKMYAHILPKDNGVLGGEVAMWSEYVDEQVLDTRVWPRAAAVAERLWSDPITSVYTAEPRLQRLRDRLIKRGLRPDALSPAWCSQHDGRCL